MKDRARQLVERGLGVPAVFVLESARPLSGLCHQFLIFMQPLVDLLGLYGSEYEHWLHLTEDRERLEGLIQEIEAQL